MRKRGQERASSVVSFEVLGRARFVVSPLVRQRRSRAGSPEREREREEIEEEERRNGNETRKKQNLFGLSCLHEEVLLCSVQQETSTRET